MHARVGGVRSSCRLPQIVPIMEARFLLLWDDALVLYLEMGKNHRGGLSFSLSLVLCVPNVQKLTTRGSLEFLERVVGNLLFLRGSHHVPYEKKNTP